VEGIGRGEGERVGSHVGLPKWLCFGFGVFVLL